MQSYCCKTTYHFTGVFFALVKDQGLHDVSRDGSGRHVQVLVPQGLQDGEALPSATSRQETVLCLHEGDHPSVALHS